MGDNFSTYAFCIYINALLVILNRDYPFSTSTIAYLDDLAIACKG